MVQWWRTLTVLVVPLSVVETVAATGDGFVHDLCPDEQPCRVGDTALFVGSQDAACNLAALRANNIRFVLNVGFARVAPAADDDDGNDVERLHLPLLDVPETLLAPVLPAAFAFLTRASATANVLVHCAAGVSRSVAVAVAWLLETRYRSSVDECLAVIRQTRPAARPNDGFLKQLEARAN